MSENADNTKDVRKYGRRATDNRPVEGGVPSSDSNMRSRLFSGFLAIGGVTALIAIGRASHTLDTVVADTASNTTVIREMLITQTELMHSINKNTEFMNRFFDQQKESDKEFLDVIRDIKAGVDRNRESIIIMQQKVSKADKTDVYIAMR